MKAAMKFAMKILRVKGVEMFLAIWAGICGELVADFSDNSHLLPLAGLTAHFR